MASSGAAGRPVRERLWSPKDLGGVELLRTQDSRHVYARHSHEGYAVGLVEAGHYGFSDRGQQWIPKPYRSVIVVNPEDVHDGRPLDGRGYDYRMFYIEAAVLAPLAAECDGGDRPVWPFFPEAMVEDGDLARRLHRLHRALEPESRRGRLERESRFVDALAGLVSRHARRKPEAVPRPTRYRRALERARGFLEAHRAENVSLSELAQEAGMSRFHLLRAFRERYGLPPHAWLMQHRLRQARRLLRAERPLVEIAGELGFADQSHFIRRFHAAYGITPGRYAQEMGG
ncbi:MAG TPA: AraC family transcriptional regulator [Gammaproteobacteria bacterium]|nr:AraC family transcriptional regulator [Gammaproteobacteria bacterium]